MSPYPFALLLTTSMVLGGAASVQTPPASPQASTFRVIRSVSGSRGTPQGTRFIVEDPRTVFNVPGDTQVIVYFEWQGPAGKHRMEGVWRDPSGRAATITNFDYEARSPQFGAYWTLTLPERVDGGSWSLEANIDGQGAGLHRFEIVAAARPPEAAAAVRRTVAPSDAYDRLRAATVLVEKLDDRGDVRATSSGVVAREGRVLTTFSAVDGAVRLKITGPKGETAEALQLQAFDRAADWALVAVPSAFGRPLEIEAERSWKVGDHLYVLSGGGAGSARTLVDVNLAGVQEEPVPERPGAGPRLHLSIPLGPDAIGGAVVNDYGAVIGLLSDPALPGASTVDFRTVGYRSTIGAEGALGGVSLARAWPKLPADEPPPSTFTELLASGQFTPLLGAGRQDVMRGAFAQQVRKAEILLEPIDEKDVFTQRAGTFSLMLNLAPKAKARTEAVFQVHSVQGKKLGESKPLKLRLDKGRPAALSWTLEAAKMSPAIYRVDIVFGVEPVWRGYMKIVP